MEGTLLMGITSISINPAIQQPALVQPAEPQDLVRFQIGSRGTSMRWFFASEAVNLVNSMALKALATLVLHLC
jgi:hypothetical protein